MKYGFTSVDTLRDKEQNVQRRKSANFPWKTGTLLTSRGTKCRLLTENNQSSRSHFVQTTGNSRRLPRTNCDFHALGRLWRFNCLFQKHVATAALVVMREFFRDRITSRNSWPLRSPDLSPPDSYLWGFWKRMCNKRPALKQNIQLCTASITISVNTVLTVPTTLHTTFASAWLGFAIGTRTDLRSVR
jgi:hypothetical protein